MGQDQLRESYEARQRLYDRDLSRHPNGAYKDARTETGWLDWQACWKLAREGMIPESLIGKPCPSCGEPMTDLRSQQVRQCTNGKCGKAWAWELKPGQKPLITTNRDTRKA